MYIQLCKIDNDYIFVNFASKLKKDYFILKK